MYTVRIHCMYAVLEFAHRKIYPKFCKNFEYSAYMLAICSSWEIRKFHNSPYICCVVPFSSYQKLNYFFLLLVVVVVTFSSSFIAHGIDQHTYSILYVVYTYVVYIYKSAHRVSFTFFFIASSSLYSELFSFRCVIICVLFFFAFTTTTSITTCIPHIKIKSHTYTHRFSVVLNIPLQFWMQYTQCHPFLMAKLMMRKTDFPFFLTFDVWLKRFWSTLFCFFFRATTSTTEEKKLDPNRIYYAYVNVYMANVCWKKML